MNINVHHTPIVCQLDGVECRVWEGVTEHGTHCNLFVHRVQAGVNHAEFEAELSEHVAPQQNTIHPEVIRDLAIAVIKSHEAVCDDPECTERGNMLAWLAHCIGATERDLRALPKLLVMYDTHCKGCPSDRHSNQETPQS